MVIDLTRSVFFDVQTTERKRVCGHRDVRSSIRTFRLDLLDDYCRTERLDVWNRNVIVVEFKFETNKWSRRDEIVIFFRSRYGVVGCTLGRLRRLNRLRVSFANRPCVGPPGRTRPPDRRPYGQGVPFERYVVHGMPLLFFFFFYRFD